MEVLERQKVLRLVVKEVLIDDETINIKHSVPFAISSKTNLSLESAKVPSCLLRSWSHQPTAIKYLPSLCIRPMGE